MIGKTRNIRTQKIWQDTLVKIDEIREAIKKDTGNVPPRTEILDAWAKSERVRLQTLNYYRKRCGLL